MPDRRGFIGSSDIAAIIGLSPFRTAYEVWEEKVAETWEESDNPVLRRGRRAEPFLLETLKSEFDVWVIDANQRAAHPKYPFLEAESDFIYVIDSNLVGECPSGDSPTAAMVPYGGDAMIGNAVANTGHGEIKSVGFNRGNWGEAGSQEVPPYYLAQAMFALACNGYPETTLWGCFSFDDIRPYRFEYDAEAGEALVQAAVNFWQNHVLPKVPPATKTVEDCKKVLARFAGFTWEATEAALDAAFRLRDYKRAIKESEALAATAEKEFLDALIAAAEVYGVTETGTKNFTILAPGGQKFATWNLQHRKGYEVKETDFRVLRFASQKGEV